MSASKGRTGSIRLAGKGNADFEPGWNDGCGIESRRTLEGDGPGKKKGPAAGCRALRKSGGDLLSHTVSHAVSSALEGLTSVFGMGTGGTPPLRPPQTVKDQ